MENPERSNGPKGAERIVFVTEPESFYDRKHLRLTDRPLKYGRRPWR